MSKVLDRLITEERREGRHEGIIETLFSLVHDGLISIEEAAKRADITTESFTESMKPFNK